MTFKKKIIISIVFFLALSILLIVFVISPLFLKIKKNSQDFLSEKQELMVLEKKVENLEKFKEILPEISSDLEKINHLFIDPEVPVDFIRFLEKTAKDSGLSRETSPGQTIKTEKDPWPSDSFHLILAGPFTNLSNFLKKLESSPYLIEVQNLNIARLTEAELRPSEFEQFSLGGIKANLSIKVYTK